MLGGDRPLFGFVRFLLLVVFPIVLVIGDLLLSILGTFSTLFQRLTLLYFLGLLSAFSAGVAYIRDIYELESEHLPLWHLVSSFLGLFVPRIKVSSRLQNASGTEMVESIGGPAYLNIASGYAVLTETLSSPANIYGPGKKFISRQERIHEFVDLHEQEGRVEKAKATTRDGIEVTVEKIRFNFRLWDDQWDTNPASGAKTLNPYPFSKHAIHNYVYNRTVAIDEHGNPKPFSWMGAVGGRVQGIIKDYISEHRLDDVIASREHTQENPRLIIRNKAYEPGFKNSLRSMGTRLRWWDPGEFKSLENIENQFLSNWSVDLKNNIELNHAFGDAQKLAYEELGRAEAEAELLMSIIHSLDGIKFASNKPQTLQNLILMRTAQVIRALNTPAPEKSPRDPERNKQDSNIKA